jgi:hypothetical protein
MNGPRRDLQFLGVTVDQRTDGTHRARVELWRRARTNTSGEKFVGNAVAQESRRAVASATLDALRRAHTGQLVQGLELAAVEILEVFGGAPVIGTALTGNLGENARFLMGFSRVVGYDAATATARAVLDATNRLLSAR